MITFRLAVRNLFRHPKKTFLMGFLIIFGMSCLFLADVVFESTNRGLEISFVGSLTGNFSISAKTESAFGLFGSEIPIVSDYESIPPIALYKEIAQALSLLENVALSTSIVSGVASVRIGKHTFPAAIFGVDPNTYFAVCTDISILSGDVNSLANDGVFLNYSMAKIAESALGRKLKVGEPVVFSMYANGSFRIRKGSFAGVHAYPSSNAALDRVVLANATLVRSIADYTMGYALTGNAIQASETNVVPSSDFSIENLFSAMTDSVADPSKAVSLESIEAEMSDTAVRDVMIQTDNAAWSFILLKARNGEQKIIMDQLGRMMENNDWEIRLQDWRGTAGSTAVLPYVVQSIFFIGLGFVLLGTVLIITNSFVISVLERTVEIGMMRGLGASAGFIRKIFIFESMILTMGSSAFGILLGIVFVAILDKLSLTFSNSILAAIFGGGEINPIVGFENVFRHVLLSFLIGAASWIYPVYLALKVQPANAMGKGC